MSDSDITSPSGVLVPMRDLEPDAGHLDGCQGDPYYLIGHDGPAGHIVLCAEGCPMLERTRQRARELAKEHGW